MIEGWKASLCVLASSSSANCSVLLLSRGGERRLILIDAGLSPRRTRAHLNALGLGEVEVCAVVLTHLDHDHCNGGWIKGLPESTRVFMHLRHRSRAEREGLLFRRTEIFRDTLEPCEGVRAAAVLGAHDAAGACVFRFETVGAGSLGYATDIGRPTAAMMDHLRGVDVLAIESNYCKEMQIASDRPDFLKERIMGGAGHLSNAESARAVAGIGPRAHVVLLHLSRQCNHPERAAKAHAGCSQPITIASPDRPTPWVNVVASARPAAGVKAHLWAMAEG